MIESIKKITKIIDEITTYFMNSGNKNLDIKISTEGKDFKLIFIVENVRLSRSELDEIQESLSIPRQEDVEEYYWQLNGASESEMEFDLIGMMIDSHRIDIQDGVLTMELIRKG